MDIIYHAHRAVISERMRLRADRAVRKVARRMGRAVDAVVRFEHDGPTRRVEIVLHAPKHKSLIAEGSSRYYGPALAEAIGRLEQQVPKKLSHKTRLRAVTRG